MKNGNAFRGLGVAMCTPFQADGKVDFPALQRLTEHLINGGVDYLVVHGTTGESPVLNAEEKRAVLDFVLEVNKNRKPVVLGIGGNDTARICQEMTTTDMTGLSGILSVSPSYNRPSQRGIIAHYEAISAACPLPIILYNVPARTGSNVKSETTLEIARRCPNVVAVKEASGDLGQIMEIIRQAPEGFTVLSGDDLLGLSVISSGGAGVISVIGNAKTESYGSLVHAALEGDLVTARALHYSLMPLITAIFKEGNPAGIKELLQLMGICDRHQRLPGVPVSKELKEEIYQLLAASEPASVSS